MGLIAIYGHKASVSCEFLVSLWAAESGKGIWSSPVALAPRGQLGWPQALARFGPKGFSSISQRPFPSTLFLSLFILSRLVVLQRYLGLVDI